MLRIQTINGVQIRLDFENEDDFKGWISSLYQSLTTTEEFSAQLEQSPATLYVHLNPGREEHVILDSGVVTEDELPMGFTAEFDTTAQGQLYLAAFKKQYPDLEFQLVPGGPLDPPLPT